MTSLEYILANFISLPQLAVLSGQSEDAIGEFIAARCLPGAAYRLEGQVALSSIFGDHKEVWAASFFPRSHVDKVRSIARQEAPLEAVRSSLEAAFKAEYRALLVELQAGTFGMAGLFNPDGSLSDRPTEGLLDREWNHYLDGTYGLCTRSASVREIATKEIMIARIKYLSTQLEQNPTDALRTDLAQAVDLLDSVSAPFAPHEVSRSSRQSYITDVKHQFLVA